MRQAKIQDISNILQLIQLSFPEEIERGMSLQPPAHYQNLIEMEEIIILVEEADTKIIGVAILEVQTAERPAELQILAVDSSYQGNGIGTNLLKAVIDLMMEKKWRKLKTSTRPWNVAMRKLMAKFGFIPEGFFKNEYLGEDLIAYAYFR